MVDAVLLPFKPARDSPGNHQHSLAVIAARLGVAPGTVHARLRERGMQMRDTHGRPG